MWEELVEVARIGHRENRIAGAPHHAHRHSAAPQLGLNAGQRIGRQGVVELVVLRAPQW